MFTFCQPEAVDHLMYDGLLVKKLHINAIQHRTSLEDGRL
jgi:hypothetical protein